MALIRLGASYAQSSTLTLSEQINTTYGVGTTTVNHNLGYMPFVKVINTDTGEEDIGVVTHSSVNSFTVSVIGSVRLTINYL